MKSLAKSSLSITLYLNGVINGQSSEVHEIKSGTPNTLYSVLPSFYNLLKNTLRSLVNVYAYVITVYGCTSKYLGDQCLEIDLSCNLGKRLAGIIQDIEK